MEERCHGFMGKKTEINDKTIAEERENNHFTMLGEDEIELKCLDDM